MKIVNWLREHKKLYKRALCGFLCGMLVFGELLPAFGADVNKAEGTIKFWQWERWDARTKKDSEYSRILIYTGDGYATVNISISSNKMNLSQVTNTYVDWNASSFITNNDLGAMGLSNDGGTNPWIFHASGSDWTEIVSLDNYTESFGYGGTWEDSDHGYWIGEGSGGYQKIVARTSRSAHYNNGVFKDGNSRLSLDSCKKADKRDTDKLLIFMGYQITFSAITADRTVVKAGSVLNVNDQVVLQHSTSGKSATIVIEEGGVLTVEGRFFLNGRIECHGTIIVNEGACIMPFDPPDCSGLGDIILAGGELVIEKGGVVWLPSERGWIDMKMDDDRNSSSYGKAATVVNNGYLILPHGYSMGNSPATIYNRGGAYMWVGYTMQAALGNLAEKEVKTDTSGGCYLDGMTAVSASDWAHAHGGNPPLSYVVNDGYIRVARKDMIVDGNLASNNGNVSTIMDAQKRAEVDSARKKAYNAKRMSFSVYRERVLKANLDSLVADYNAIAAAGDDFSRIPNTLKTKYKITNTYRISLVKQSLAGEVNRAQATYNYPDAAYEQYSQQVWSEIVKLYPYSDANVNTIGSVGVG